jgi:hypothetical protein
MAEMWYQIQRLDRTNSDIADRETIRENYRDLFPEVQLVIGTTKCSRGSSVHDSNRQQSRRPSRN